MAPSTQSNSQQLIAQAADQLAQAVREVGQSPNDFAKSLLDLMEVSAKVAEFDEMAAAASKEAESEEAKQWQEISMLTLKYCRQGLIDEQQRAIKQVCGLAEQGASLFHKGADAAKEVPAAAAPEAAPCVRPPPGVWAKGPPGFSAPPGLAPPPPGLPAPPGLETCTKASGKVPTEAARAGKPAAQPSKASSNLPPWRKSPKVGPAKEPAQEVAKETAKEAHAEPPASGGCALNLDAYSDGSDSD